MESPGFRELWRVELLDWAYFMIVRQGVVYSTWSSGSLSAVDLYTGALLREVPGVALATAPFTVADRIYSYWVGGQLYELDLHSFDLLRVITIPHGGYLEAIPYDADTDQFFIWRWIDEEAWFSAMRLEDGAEAWLTAFPLGPSISNSGSPVLPGDDSVYVQAANGLNRVYRFDKRTGALRWMTCLTPGDRVDFNNMVYDRAHDVFYVSTVDAHCFAVRRTDGAVVWSHAFPGHEVHATLSYHDGLVYVPLVQTAVAPAACAALNATNGVPRWIKPGFFGEDGWSAMAVDDRYLYRNTHSGDGHIIVQDRFTGDLVWAGDAGGPQPCTNPVQSDGIVLFGNNQYLIALQTGAGLPVDCDWHGVYGTGYNPGAILWDTPPPNLDIDNDRLPDLWELDSFGHLFASGTDDSDEDGSNDYDEYVAGTSCRSATDCLRLHFFPSGKPDILTFTSRLASGLAYWGKRRFYAVESAPAVTGRDWVPLPGAGRLPADGGLKAIPLAVEQTGGFYRVRAWLEP